MGSLSAPPGSLGRVKCWWEGKGIAAGAGFGDNNAAVLFSFLSQEFPHVSFALLFAT